MTITYTPNVEYYRNILDNSQLAKQDYENAMVRQEAMKQQAAMGNGAFVRELVQEPKKDKRVLLCQG